MGKLNFATRVSVATTAKADSSNMYANERVKVQAQTNSRQLVLDKSVFSKTDLEKQELKNAKSRWKRLNGLR